MQFRDLKSQYRALKPQMDEAIQAVIKEVKLKPKAFVVVDLF